jgi:hypothetical protein
VDPLHFCTDPDPRIRTIYIRLRIRIRILLFFCQWLTRYLQKSLFAYYVLKVIYISFHTIEIKSKKESQNSKNHCFSCFFCLLMERSGAGSVQHNQIKKIKSKFLFFISHIRYDTYFYICFYKKKTQCRELIVIGGFEAGFWRPKNIRILRIRSRIHNTDIYDNNINLGTRMLALLRVERRQRLPAPRLRDSKFAWTTFRLVPRVPYLTHCHSPDPVSRIRIRLIRDWKWGRDGMGAGMEWGQGQRHGGRDGMGGGDGMGAGMEWGQGWNGGRDELGAGMEWGQGWNGGQGWNRGRDGIKAGIVWGQEWNEGRGGMEQVWLALKPSIFGKSRRVGGGDSGEGSPQG